MSRNKFRADDKMVTVEIESAVIDFADIVEACIVSEDQHYHEKPWDTQCGYDHETEKARHYKNACERRGYTSGTLVILDDKVGDDVYRWARERGASKQVAAELRARDRQRTLDQLVQWHSNGWEWYSVTCEFLGAFDSLCGIDDYDYASGEVCRDIAREVAAQLEAQGYTVENQPEPAKRTRTSQVNFFNWS